MKYFFVNKFPLEIQLCQSRRIDQIQKTTSRRNSRKRLMHSDGSCALINKHGSTVHTQRILNLRLHQHRRYVIKSLSGGISIVSLAFYTL